MAVDPTRSAKTKTTNRVFLLKIDKTHSSNAASETLQGATALWKSAPHHTAPPRATAL
jgi:hypothetical protein